MNASLFYCAACGAFVVFALSLLGPNEVLLPGIVEATVSAVRFAFEKSRYLSNEDENTCRRLSSMWAIRTCVGRWLNPG